MVGAEHNALLITLEHRYYGASQPFENWSTENLKFLSSEQALADLAYFIESMNAEWKESIGREPEWITVGGSYPGALSAWFKHLYPDHAIGSWSSSGVIHAVEDFRDFDHSLYTSTSKSGAECPSLIKAQTEWAEAKFNSDEGIQEICDIFGIDPATIHPFDYFFYLADHYTIGVQYGHRTTLCDMIMGNADLSMHDQMAAVAAFGVSQGVVYSDYNAAQLEITTINTNTSGRQWTY